MSGALTIRLDFAQPRNLGRVAWDARAQVAVVEWDAGFLADPLPLSPYVIRAFAGLHRATSAAFDGLPGFLGDALPDGWARGQDGLGYVGPTPVDRLARIGAHGMGALSFQPEAEPVPPAAPDLDWFARIAGAQAVEALSLDALVGAGGAGGARPKLAAWLTPGNALRDHRVGTGAGAEDRAVLIKSAGAGDPPSMAQEEQAYALMARAAGVEMGRTQVLFARSGQSFFVADRFDRGAGGRLHLHSAAGLLEVDFRKPSIDYDGLIRLVRFVTRDMRAVREMVLRMMFNVAAGNRNDHLKNHAFVMDGQGAWRLSPAYDLCLSDGPDGAHSLAIAGQGHRPDASHLRKVALDAGLKPREVAGMLDAVRGAVAGWSKYAEMAEVPRHRRVAVAARLVEVSPFR